VPLFALIGSFVKRTVSENVLQLFVQSRFRAEQ
jgi:hypothetical protein